MLCHGRGREFGSRRPRQSLPAVAKSLASRRRTKERQKVSRPSPQQQFECAPANHSHNFALCSCIDELAEKAAAKAAVLKRYFPNVVIGEIDAVNSRLPGLINAEIGFLDAFHKKSGLRPEFFHADVAWDSDWRPGLTDLARRLRARGIRLGVVCDGNLNPPSDAQWVTQSLQRCQMLADDPKIAPDDFVVQTWTAWPHRMLPETDPSSWTYAAKQIAAQVQTR